MPKKGLTTPHNNMISPVLSIEVYYLLAAISGATLHNNQCHVVATITPYGKILNDISLKKKQMQKLT